MRTCDEMTDSSDEFLPEEPAEAPTDGYLLDIYEKTAGYVTSLEEESG